jgi:uncharacterized peroxidase-related enzyme
LAVVNRIIKDQAVTEVKEIYDSLESQYGYVPAFYAAMAHHPDALKTFLPFYRSIMAKGSVEPRYKELVYLKTSMLNHCSYCTRAHTSAAKRAGITPGQIKALPTYQYSHDFDDKEKAILQFAESITLKAASDTAKFTENLKKYLSEKQIVELTLTICMANFTNRFNNALELEPDIG